MQDTLQQQPVNTTNETCLKLLVTGYVQGVGFRPFVYRLAKSMHIKGYIANNCGQVTIVVQATKARLDQFCKRLIHEAPVNAKPSLDAITDVASENQQLADDFIIKQSNALSRNDIHILPDLPVCQACLDEMFDKNNRRYQYPFINCTQCGPRNSIINSLPYDRHNTSMEPFKLCSACTAEYHDPTNRRFHAEPVACETCGPVLTYSDSQNSISGNESALTACIEALQAGKIVAVKGIGGYHLMCDATSAEAVALLRQRKQRPDKPFAVLMQMQELSAYVVTRSQDMELLSQNCRPIVLLKPQAKNNLAENIAPGFHRVGVMLPNSPLQYLICDRMQKPLVATSANISGEPIITRNVDASARLATLCDGFLHHDREIVRPADDPVMVNGFTSSQLIRTGRGLSPTELTLPFVLPQPVLAVGGHSKNTVALGWDNRLVISSHNGDLDSLRSYQTFQQNIEDLQRLYQVRAEHVVCDAHPGYASTQWASESGLPLTRVFHHHAHASSVIFEPLYKKSHAQSCLMFSWDGVGLGEDGSLWGGETFLGRPGAWQRVASFTPFSLPGGEKTSREAWRIAAALCWQTGLNVSFNEQRIAANTIAALKQVWEKNINSPGTSAAGRLFSAAAAMLGLLEKESFEGHGPMLLEALAETALAETALAETALAKTITLPLEKDSDGVLRVGWEPLVAMLQDNRMGKAERARCFHESMAQSVADLVRYFTQDEDDLTIGLSGGVFQNQLLLRLIKQRLDEMAVNIVLPTDIPVNDGGLCAGQLVEYYYR